MCHCAPFFFCSRFIRGGAKERNKCDRIDAKNRSLAHCIFSVHFGFGFSHFPFSPEKRFILSLSHSFFRSPLDRMCVCVCASLGAAGVSVRV